MLNCTIVTAFRVPKEIHTYLYVVIISSSSTIIVKTITYRAVCSF